MEVCVDSITSALEAVRGGASRLELCSALSEDGLTPSVGLFEVIKSLVSIPIFVMIRPKHIRNYNYNDNEIQEMEIDINTFKSKGANGLVFGCLTQERYVDENVCQRLLQISKPLPVTFHRAFDITVDPFASMETIIQLGFTRILTSGQKKSALEGVNLVRDLVKRSAGRIIIVPGAGISEENLSYILEATKAIEFHSSAKKAMSLQQGSSIDVLGKVFVTCSSQVEAMVIISNNVFAALRNENQTKSLINCKR